MCTIIALFAPTDKQKQRSPWLRAFKRGVFFKPWASGRPANPEHFLFSSYKARRVFIDSALSCTNPAIAIPAVHQNHRNNPAMPAACPTHQSALLTQSSPGNRHGRTRLRKHIRHQPVIGCRIDVELWDDDDCWRVGYCKRNIWGNKQLRASLKGAGPISGTFGVSPATESVRGLQNFFPRREAVEFIFDPASMTFVVGNGRMKHSSLAACLAADTTQVVGGIFSRGSSGTMLTNEASGHFWQNWTPQVRQQFTDFMKSKGLNLIHQKGM